MRSSSICYSRPEKEVYTHAISDMNIFASTDFTITEMQSPSSARDRMEFRSPIASTKRKQRRHDLNSVLTPSPLRASEEEPQCATATKKMRAKRLRNAERVSDSEGLNSTLLSFSEVGDCEQEAEDVVVNAKTVNKAESESHLRVFSSKIFEVVDSQHRRKAFRADKGDETVREFLYRVLKVAGGSLESAAFRGEDGVVVPMSEKMRNLDGSMSFSVIDASKEQLKYAE